MINAILRVDDAPFTVNFLRTLSIILISNTCLLLQLSPLCYSYNLVLYFAIFTIQMTILRVFS